MKLLFDFFPLILFFIGFKCFGLYGATAIAIVASFIQVIFYRIKHRRFEKMHLISLALIVLMGGATLFFHNPWFIKWKPSVIYWITALIFLFSSFIGKKPLLQRMMQENIQLPEKTWSLLNYAWGFFFLLMGILNIYVAYHFTTDQWVNFKLFGSAGLTLFFVILQALYLEKYLSISHQKVLESTKNDTQKAKGNYE